MVTDLQKASLWKRISAGLFDVILLIMLAVGMATLLSWVCGYDAHNQAYDDICVAYETQYDVTFQITQEQYDGFSEAERQAYDTAYDALIADPEVIYLYNLLNNLRLLILTFAILLAVIALELVVPLLFKNGQTLGKKIFGVALMRADGVKVNTFQMFVRTVLGKFTIEIMIPVYIIMMILTNSIGVIALAILGGLLVGELLSLVLSKTGSLIHDTIAATIAVDMASQRIFETPEERVEYVKRLHAEEASRQEY